MDMSLNNFWEMVKKRQAWCAAVRGVSELDMTEQLSNNKFPYKEWHQPDCYQIWGIFPIIPPGHPPCSDFHAWRAGMVDDYGILVY